MGKIFSLCSLCPSSQDSFISMFRDCLCLVNKNDMFVYEKSKYVSWPELLKAERSLCRYVESDLNGL